MTTADTVDYVSDMDPAKKQVKKPKARPIADAGKPIEADKIEYETVAEIGEGATIFKLRTLDVFLMGYIYDNASYLAQKPQSNEVGIHTRVNQTNMETVRHGLTGFVNFADAKGGQIVFKSQKEIVNGRVYDVVSDEVMNKLGVRLIQELATKIKSLSEVSAAEEKNSVGA